MSEPITRADYAKWLLSCGDLEMHAMFEDWCAHNPAESASPPRVPGPSAQFAKVGVQSGPGQPTDLAERMDKRAERLRVHDWSVSDSITAQILREAAAEVRRLRAERDAYKAGLDVARDSDREAAQLIERGYRAGIEEAARYHDAKAISAENRQAFDTARRHNADAAAIRALADKPAPVWTQEELDAAKAEGQRLADYFRDAARKGG